MRRHSRSVLECGSPVPLWLRGRIGHAEPLLPRCLSPIRSASWGAALAILCAVAFYSPTQAAIAASPTGAATGDELTAGFATPPNSARLRAYWWWLNGNVTKASITRDLEEMKAKGFGGALICDAGGAEQDGNSRVPHGPTFFTPEWRELYKHTLREADRLGLEMSLNILSGWNLGGPNVKAEDAAKKLTWSEEVVTGPTNFAHALRTPKSRDGYYQDIAVLAYRCKAAPPQPGFASIAASSYQPGQDPQLACDGKPGTHWVSAGSKPGEGPTPKHPEWIQVSFFQPVHGLMLNITGRPGYGPKECELQLSSDGKSFQTERRFSMEDGKAKVLTLPDANATFVRIRILAAYDHGSPEAPRNVQISEITYYSKDHPLGQPARQPLKNWEEKAIHRPLHSSAPDTSPLFEEFPAVPGEEDAKAAEVLNLTAKLSKDGVLRWNAPEGTWQVLRLGCTIGDHSHVSTCSDGWQGYALDVLDAGAFNRYWDAIVEPLIADAGPLAGRTLKYLHTDSWEVEPLNWTPNLRAEFRKRRGYDPLPFYPVLMGRIIDSRDASDRFLYDFRKTLGDLAIDNHFRIFVERAHKHGLQIHPESGGPHAVPIDAQRCLGMDDAPMSEFWAWSWRHRIGDDNRFFVKQPASAAHTYGHRLVVAEGFTDMGPHWQESLCENLKPCFDQALCEGMNLLVWHAFVCSPAEMGMPGQQYFAGTHFNPNTTWWNKSGAFLSYIDRCQFLLQQGLFVADVCYYYGDHVPNFAQLKRIDPAHVLPGYDYDVATEEVVLKRMSVREGRIVLPDGMSYRALVLPNRPGISLPVLQKLKAMVKDGATIIGPKPTQTYSLSGFPKSDAEVKRLGDELWGNDGRAAHLRGRTVADQTARQVLLADGIKPDFEYHLQSPSSTPQAPAAVYLDYIHRSAKGAEIYFVASRSNCWVAADCTFRVAGKNPELWDPLTGSRYAMPTAMQSEGRMTLPLQFPPYGSWFVVFRTPAAPTVAATAPAHPEIPAPPVAQELSGPWTVHFDPKWGGPESVVFEQLVSWPQRPEQGIRYYSGTARYEQTFDLPQGLRREPGQRLMLDLGDVKNLAEVRLNGTNLGVLWALPFRVEVTDALKPTGNKLQVEIVNFWPNRIIGDQSLPPEKRFTRTNIRKLTKDTALMESGLLGPVRILAEHN
jgi:(4-O-methyl)-D-glucuronate---lignin esterase